MNNDSLDHEKEVEYLNHCIDQNIKHFQLFSIVAVLALVIMELLLLLAQPANSGILIPLNVIIFPLLLLNICLFYGLSRVQLVKSLHFLSAITMIIVGPVFVTMMRTLLSSPHHALYPYYIIIMFSVIYIFKVRFIVVAIVEKFICFPLWVFIATNYHDPETTESSIILWTSLLFFAWFAYDQEQKLKSRFLSNERFMQISHKLKNQLSTLANNFSDRGPDLDSPIERALNGIGELLASPDVNIEHIRTLKFIYECLNTSDLLNYSPVKVKDIMPDDEEQKVIYF